ncbi:MAG TPA: hypothetical protein PKE16_02045 [Hyphomicrobium sp.]|nr:hypothetical protein [Hyphomicrobium sp.]
MNYYSHSGDFYFSQPNRTGALYNVLILTIFLSLLVFGIFSTYGLG